MESLTGPGETYGTVSVQAKQMAVDETPPAESRPAARTMVEDRSAAQDAIIAYNKLTDVDASSVAAQTTAIQTTFSAHRTLH